MKGGIFSREMTPLATWSELFMIQFKELPEVDQMFIQIVL